MTQRLPDPSVVLTALANVPAAGQDTLAQFQALARQVLDLQQSQHRLVERLLESHDRMLGYAPPLEIPQAPSAPAPAPAALPAPPPRALPKPQPIIMPLPASAPSLAAMSAPVQRKPIVISRASSANGLLTHAEPTASPRFVAAPVAASTNGAGPPTTDQFRLDLLQVVSDKTGYPPDMLDEKLPLEAGLGIDSIKTVEIFSNLKQYHAYFQVPGQDEEETLTGFTKLKTLRDIIDAYDNRRQAFLGAASAKAAQPVLAAARNGSAGDHAPLERYTLTATLAEDQPGVKKKSLTEAPSSSSAK